MKKLLLLLGLPFFCAAQIPQYYNSVDFTLTGDALKTQLATLITNTHTTQLIYTPDVWNALKQTDLDPTNPDNVLLIYGYDDNDSALNNDRTRSKDLSCHTSSCAGHWVREHVFARSLGNPNLEFEGPGSDAHHLRAIDNSMNGSRSNRKFVDDSGNAHTLPNDQFYPGDEWKGDIARMIMYMYVRYGNQCQPAYIGIGDTNYSINGDMMNVFLEWNQEDPVSQYEINRNNILQNMQGNRNPFIDNPYLATKIWNGPQAQDNWDLLSVTAQEIQNVFVYPTLTKGEINIANTQNHTYTYTVYNTLGQKVPFTATSTTVNIESNVAGLYFLTLNDGKAQKTFKIIKQ
jgi:endonuclease I